MPVTILKGNPLLTWRTMFLWTWPLFIFVLSIFGFLFFKVIVIIGLLIYIAMFLYHIQYVYYFSISEKEIMVSNHFRSRYRKSFLLSEINSIRIDMNHFFGSKKTEPYFLRIYNTPLVSETFKACTLRKKEWRALQSLLENEGIRVVSTYPQIDIKFSDML